MQGKTAIAVAFAVLAGRRLRKQLPTVSSGHGPTRPEHHNHGADDHHHHDAAPYDNHSAATDNTPAAAAPRRPSPSRTGTAGIAGAPSPHHLGYMVSTDHLCTDAELAADPPQQSQEHEHGRLWSHPVVLVLLGLGAHSTAPPRPLHAKRPPLHRRRAGSIRPVGPAARWTSARSPGDRQCRHLNDSHDATNSHVRCEHRPFTTTRRSRPGRRARHGHRARSQPVNVTGYRLPRTQPFP